MILRDSKLTFATAGNDGRHVSKFVAHTFTAALRTLMLQPHFPFEYHNPMTPSGGLTGQNFGTPWVVLLVVTVVPVLVTVTILVYKVL